MLAYPAATFDKLTSGAAWNARAIVFNKPEATAILGGEMKRLTLPILSGLMIAIYVLAPGVSPAQQKGPTDERIKGAYQQVLAEADKNRDGKLSMSECMAVWKDKMTGEKNCKHWDANGDGVITEDEYVKQVRKIMR